MDIWRCSWYAALRSRSRRSAASCADMRCCGISTQLIKSASLSSSSGSKSAQSAQHRTSIWDMQLALIQALGAFKAASCPDMRCCRDSTRSICKPLLFLRLQGCPICTASHKHLEHAALLYTSNESLSFNAASCSDMHYCGMSTRPINSTSLSASSGSRGAQSAQHRKNTWRMRLPLIQAVGSCRSMQLPALAFPDVKFPSN